MNPRVGNRAEARFRPPDPEWAPLVSPDSRAVSALVEGLKLPEALCSVLALRGLEDLAEAKRFLRPRLTHLADASGLADGPRAASRIAEAISSGETIFVHGDYDVDGICATALYTRWLASLGGTVVPFVPHRLRDGYDFSDAGLAAASAAGASLIVTADCGTSAHETVGRARASGIDVVVTDHHAVGETLPGAVAVVNPQRHDCPYPEKGLCGTGLAYRMCELVAEARGVSSDELAGYLDLVALATVADLVPLRGENRVFVTYGLRCFGHTRVPGIAALLEVAGVPPTEVTAGKLGFVVAPRINAAGRVGESADALRLLMTDDRREAEELAARLDATNLARREEDARTLDQALELLDESYDPGRDFGVVLAAEGWHPGVIGIVASRVVEQVHRPVVMLALNGQEARGSARSIPGFHLHEALTECAEHMRRFGGHAQAAGMDVARESVPGFREAFNEVARARLSPRDLRPVLRPDARLQPNAADLDLARWLEYLGPHGIGNPGPLFLAEGVSLESPRVVGERHLKVRLVRDGAALDGIGFGLAARHPPDALGPGPFDVLYRLERNQWRGVTKPQARLVDLRRSAGSEPAS